MAENKNWGYLAQYSILKEMLADLHTIAGVCHNCDDGDCHCDDDDDK